MILIIFLVVISILCNRSPSRVNNGTGIYNSYMVLQVWNMRANNGVIGVIMNDYIYYFYNH